MKNKGHHLSGCIEFEVAVVRLENKQGGIKLFVVDASGKYASENITKIKFKVEKDKGVAVDSTNTIDYSKAII
jgi:hypothetical protein